MKKSRTVRRTLIGTNSAIIILSFFVLAAVLSLLQVSRIREQSLSRLEQESRAAALEIDRETDQMRTMAMNIVYSTRMQNRLLLPNASGDSEKLFAILSLIILPNRPIDQINVYTLDGMRVSSGLENSVTEGTPEDRPWYRELAQSEERQSLRFTGPDEALAKYTTDVYGRRFVTLAMRNYDNFGTFCGYIEIMQRVSRVVNTLFSYEPAYGEEQYLFDREGRQIYPLGDGKTELFSLAREQGFSGEWFYAQTSEGRVMLHCIPSADQFYMLTLIRPWDLLRPAMEQILVILGITLAVLVLTIIVSSLAARRITSPIAEISAQLSAIDIEHPASLPALHTDIAELQSLHSSFDQMQHTLAEHVSRLLELQNQEMQSRILALQAQMNPHFLFNSLQTLQAMAEEGMNAEIGEMCQAMADILRYISSDSAQRVPLEEELKHTREFLRCMEIRYQGDLTYSVSVPEAMNGVLVPKLCVQLLAENAIKFTTTLRPPYRIRIEGFTREDGYELRIRDNGPGFDREILEKLEAQMREIRQTHTLPSLKINGMGILHVYIRFCLLYEDDFTFRLENNPDGGACVVIGAKKDEQNL